MPKVLFIKKHFSSGGGLEKTANAIIAHFLTYPNHLFHLSSSSCSALNIKTHLHPSPSKIKFIDLLSFDSFCNNLILSTKPDIIFGFDRSSLQTHHRAGNGVHMAFLEIRKKIDPIFKTISCKINPLHQTILHLEKKLFSSGSLKKIIVNSNLAASQLLKYYPNCTGKIKLLYNGVEWEKYSPYFENWPLQKKLFCQKFGYSISQLHLLFVGNGFYRKGLDQLLNALSILKNNNVMLSVVGKDKNIKKYQQLVHKLKIEKNVRFWKEIKNPLPFYQLADCVIIPSFYDPFANVTLEALAMGVKVISSKLNGGHEILNKENGKVIEDIFSIDSIVCSINEALRQKTEKEAKIIRAGSQQFSFDKHLKTVAKEILNDSA